MAGEAGAGSVGSTRRSLDSPGGLFDLVRSLWTPTRTPTTDNPTIDTSQPPKIPSLIASSPVLKRRRQPEDDAGAATSTSSTPGHERRKAKRPATKNRNSLDSVTSVGSGVGALLGTIFSPVYNWATGAADLGLQSPSAEAAAATVRENNASDATTVSTYTVAANVQEDDDLYAFDPWDFIRSIPPLHEVDGGKWVDREHVLPPLRKADSKRLTLVLDLDETLVHCDVNEMSDYDYVFPVFLGSREYTVYARRRPHMFEFLKRVSELFEVVLFTASQQVYADELLNLFDADRQLIHHRLFRGDCVEVEGNYVKDLHVLGRDLAKTLIVDNSVQAFAYQVENGIHIKTWHDDVDDEELLHLLPFLETLAQDNVGDIRPLLEKKFGLTSLIKG